MYEPLELLSTLSLTWSCSAYPVWGNVADHSDKRKTRLLKGVDSFYGEDESDLIYDIKHDASGCVVFGDEV